MKKSKIARWIAAAGTGLAFLFALIIPMGGGIFGSPSGSKSGTDNIPVAEAAATVTYPTDASSHGLGEFPVDYSFVYTDKDKAVNFHNGSGDSDLTKVTVTNAVHGSQSNPYVIASTADWEKFVEYISKDTSTTIYGEGEFFVLANDIDFSSVTDFHMVPVFCGTFYGLGHTLSNITSKTWKTYNGASTNTATTWGWGLFGRVYNSTITDLILKDFSFQTVPQGKETHDNRGGAIGGIAGYSSGKDYFLNCHTNGSVSSTITFSTHIPLGGICGAAYSNLTTTFYRCSSEIICASIKTTNGSRVVVPAPIIGENYHCGNKIYLYDCAGNVTVNEATGSYGVYAAVGPAITGRGASVYIDGLVGKMQFKVPSDSTPAYTGSVTGAFSSESYYMSIQNVFTEGVVKLSSGYRSLNVVVGDSRPTASTPYLKNVHFAKAYNWATYVADVVSQTTNNPSAVTQHNTFSALMTEAKGAVGTEGEAALNSKIWNASKIGGTYEPANSPVRNYLTVTPEDVSVVYTGEQAVFTGADWYVDSIHGNTDIMTVTSGTMVNVSDSGYNVTFNLNNGYTWSDGTTNPKTVKVYITPKKLTYSWDNSSGATVAKITGGLVAKDIGKAPKIIHTYYELDGTKLPGTPQTVGDYKVSISLPANCNYTFKDNETDEDPSVTFPLNAIPINTPTVSGNASVQYTGEDVVFTLANTHQMGDQGGEGIFIEKHPYEVSAGATYHYDEATGTRTVTAKAVGTYEVKFALYDQTNNCWADGSGILTLTIEPFPIEIYVEKEGVVDTVWEFETNTNESFTIRHNALKETDNIQYSITYEKPNNGGTVTVGSNMLKQDPDNARKTIVTLDPLDAGRHKIRVELADPTSANANGNYAFEQVFIEQEVEVVGKKVELKDSDIIWQYSDGRTSGLFSDLTNNQIEYNGRTVTASIKTDTLAAKGVRVKEYVDGKVDETQYSPTGQNAGTYKTRVVLTKLNDSYNFEDRYFDISWEITKAIFDLSNVKWDCEGTVGYTGNPIKVQLINVPSQLTATYLNNIETQVNTGSGSYKATVRFKPKNEADKDNYFVPSGKVSSGTYLYDKGDEFPWDLEWRIVKGVIDINWDLDGKEATGVGGYQYTYPTLLGGGDNVEYKLYKEIDGAQALVPTAFSDVTEPAANTKEWYYVVASLKPTSANNFEFGEGDPKLRFAIGDYRQAVRVTITQSGGMYNGEPHPIEFTFDTLSRSDFEVTYLDEKGIALSGAPVNAGRYTAKISVKGSKADGYYVVNRSHSFVIEKFKIELSDLKWDYDPEHPFVFTREWDDGAGAYVDKFFTVRLLNVPKTLSLIYTKNEFSAAGTYVATVAFGGDINGEGLDEGEEGFDFSNFDIENFKNPITGRYELPESVRTLKWTIEKRTITKPVSSTGEKYDGSSHDLVELIGLGEDWKAYITLSVKKGSADLTEDMANADYLTVNAGTYTITCTAISSLRNSVIWSDGSVIDKTVTVKIDPLYIKLLKWEGKPARPVFEDGAGESYYKVVYQKSVGGELIEISAAEAETTYNVDIIASVEVSDEMAGNVYINYDENVETTSTFKMFQGEPIPLDRPTLVKPVLEYNFEEQTFVIKNWNAYYSGKVTVVGANGKDTPLKVDRDFIGVRTVRIALNPDVNYCWKGDLDKRYEVVELVIEVVAAKLPQIWDVDANGIPVLSFDDMEMDAELLASLVEYEYYDMEGMPVNSKRMKQGVKYKAVAIIKEEYANFFCFGKSAEEGTLIGTSEEYEFIFGATDDPNPLPPGGGDNGDGNTLNIPLWQVIVSGVSTVLFVVCAVKTYSNLSKAKAARRETKELASQSYSVNYGFAPLPLMAVGSFLGMGETPWTIIAFVTLGLFLVSLMAVLLTSKKRKAAELALKREQARIAEEKEFAREEEMMRRDEEQKRRDNELRMMFAAMQQGYQQPQMQYDDMRSMIAETMQAFLPAAVQQLQALPPAQSDSNMYAQPQPGYGAQGYDSPVDNARSQKEDMLLERLARQEELINQLLQNQAAQQSAPVYEEEPVDDISWLGESDEAVSLEESYGALSDEEKRAYYDVGSYIMSKPRTSQNDGRYAVLFKYRGRTVFKLAIKDDAPVLYYPLNGGRGEVRIADPASLETAKSMIDRCVLAVDNELN